MNLVLFGGFLCNLEGNCVNLITSSAVALGGHSDRPIYETIILPLNNHFSKRGFWCKVFLIWKYYDPKLNIIWSLNFLKSVHIFFVHKWVQFR